ncbi:MAG TPA: hypothetical protein VFD60_01075 [Nitrososphaeraceae archaeon]|nr:hypothetical protein [Nitrososphaeraceae archaeon]
MSTILLSGNKKNKEQHLMLILMFVGVAATAVLIPLISIVGLSTMNVKSSSQSSLGDMCKENALKYEQLGYYKGGAAQFNAVMATCAIGSSSI